MKAVKESLESFFHKSDPFRTNENLYRSLKPLLCAENLFPSAEDLRLDSLAYLKFQENLQEIASLPHGMDLALSLMVEVNVALGILLHSHSNLARVLEKRMKSGEFILATGVSEPGWEGALRKLTSHLTEDRKLTGTKSFVTNGGSADAVLWVTVAKDSFPVYLVDLAKHKDKIERFPISTPFLEHVSHTKFIANQIQLREEDLVLEDYKHLGTELRLKELFGIVSLLLGYVQSVPDFQKSKKLEEEWKILKDWRDRTCTDLTPKNYQAVLESAFPFPIEDLLDALCHHYEIEDPKDLPKKNPDLMIFLWEDHFTKYLRLKKGKGKSS